MDIRERLAEVTHEKSTLAWALRTYQRKVNRAKAGERSQIALPPNWTPTKEMELDIEISWLERQLTNEIEERLESEYAMSYATEKARERNHEAGDDAMTEIIERLKSHTDGLAE